MKKRDKTLQNNEEALNETWQIVKESVRQLKHDNKRNQILKAIRTSSRNVNNTLLQDTENIPVNLIVD